MLLIIGPVAFVFDERVWIVWAIFFTEAGSSALSKVALVYWLCVKILVPAEAIELAVLEHASVNEVLGLKHSIAIKVSAVELADVDLLFITSEKVLSIAGHLSVNPLAFVPLSRWDDELDPNSILLAVAELPLVDVAIVVSDFTYALNLIVFPDSFKDGSGFRNEFSNSMLGYLIGMHEFTLVDVPIRLVQNSEVFTVGFLSLVVKS
jgi:hypothetical protein